MKRKITAWIISAVLCCCMVMPSLAAEKSPRLTDSANLLSQSEKAEVLNQLDEISQRQKMDVTIATVPDLDGYATATTYADALYEHCQYGYGANRDGLLLLISMEERDWAISTCGYGITAFTDAGMDYISEQIKPALSDGDYAAAFSRYAELCDGFITQARTGKPYDTGNLPREPLSMIWIPISIVIGVVLALLIVGGMKGKLKTVRTQAAANSYLKKDSLAITESSDLFLYHNVTRTEKPKENSSSGSSTHTSSSGTTHGGRSGKF